MEIPCLSFKKYHVEIELFGFSESWLNTLEAGVAALLDPEGEVSVIENGPGYFYLMASSEDEGCMGKVEKYLRRLYPLALQSCLATRAAERKQEERRQMKRRQYDLFRPQAV